MRAAEEDRAGRATHAAARWPAVVRTLVLLGLSPSEAARVGADGVARMLDDTGGDDHEVALFGAVLDAWESDERWWVGGHPAGIDDHLERALDRLEVSTRARVLLEHVARLAPQQVDEVVLGGGSDCPAWIGPAAARAADEIDVDALVAGAATRAARGRRVRRRTAVGAGLAAAVAAGVVGVVGVVGADAPDPRPAAGAPLGLPSEVPISDRIVADVTVPWYDGTALHIGDVTVGLEGLGALEVVQDGVAGVLDDGTVVSVNRSGAVAAIGTTTPGATVAGSPSSPGVAWIDPDGALRVGDLPSGPLTLGLPDGATLLGRDGATTYLDTAVGHLVVSDVGRYTSAAGPSPVFTAGGVRVDRSPRGLAVAGPDGNLELEGFLDARVSEDGRYLLARSASATERGLDTVVDLRRHREVRIPVPEDGGIVDSAFGAPGTLVLVLALPDNTQVRRAGPRGDFAGFDLVTCSLRRVTCESAVRLDTLEIPPQLAH